MAEQTVGCRTLQACLDRHHGREGSEVELLT